MPRSGGASARAAREVARAEHQVPHPLRMPPRQLHCRARAGRDRHHIHLRQTRWSSRATKASAWSAPDGSSGRLESRYPKREGAITAPQPAWPWRRPCRGGSAPPRHRSARRSPGYRCHQHRTTSPTATDPVADHSEFSTGPGSCERRLGASPNPRPPVPSTAGATRFRRPRPLYRSASPGRQVPSPRPPTRLGGARACDAAPARARAPAPPDLGWRQSYGTAGGPHGRHRPPAQDRAR